MLRSLSSRWRQESVGIMLVSTILETAISYTTTSLGGHSIDKSYLLPGFRRIFERKSMVME